MNRLVHVASFIALQHATQDLASKVQENCTGIGLGKAWERSYIH